MARVLLVEDDRDIRTLVEHQLGSSGHLVRAFGSPVEALAAVDAKGAPDIAVLDIDLPGMTGLDLARALREKEGLCAIAIVFLSGRLEDADVEAGRAMGATYLTKPFVLNALLGAIERAIPKTTTW